MSFSFNAATKKLNIFYRGRWFWPGRQEIVLGAGNIGHRVHTEWQLSLSGVHSIMMEKLAQPGEGKGVQATLFIISTITYKVVVYAPAENADTLPLFLLYPYMYSVI